MSLEEKKIPPETPALLCGYIKHERLGKGSYGTVYRVEDPETHISYALKQFKPVQDMKGFSGDVIKEMNMLASLNHPNIVKPHNILERL